MSLEATVARAVRIVDSFGGAQQGRLAVLCDGIQAAQINLVHHARSLFDECLGRCEGMCCRNIQIDDIISLLDIVYILTADPEVRGPVMMMSRQQNLFSADCVFLRNGHGPCLFKPTIKPEMCIATFCGDVRPVRAQLKQLRAEFGRLHRFVMRQRPLLWFG